MNRIPLALIALLLVALCSTPACVGQSAEPAELTQPAWFVNSQGDTIQRIVKSEDTWAQELPKFAYYVLREDGTERAFTGELWDNKSDGTYLCAGCELPLFASDTKYQSGTGWPSFYEPLDPVHVGEDSDRKLGYVRTEVHCNRCGGHLGHVFPDGPPPTGLRYCINSVSLKFEPKS